MPKIKTTLITGRTINQGTSKEHGKLTLEYQENVAIAELDPTDLKQLGIKENTNIKLTTEHGTTVVKAKKSQRAPHPKITYMPYSIWANTLTEPKTHGTGMPTFKGTPAEIQPAPHQNVPTILQLLKQTHRKKPQCQQ